MKKWVIAMAVMAWMTIGLGRPILAQPDTEERIKQLEEEFSQLKEEISLTEAEPPLEEASKLSFHGYGELHYNNPEGSGVPGGDDPAAMDFHRMVWGLSYYFNDWISLHTEVDFEHAAQELELEFAYLDFLVNPAFNVRAGAVLMPVGPLNEFHEPPLFYSVERPYVQNVIIPTTWQEGGAGIFGSPLTGLKYRLYVVSGLNASKFRHSDGIRKGRGKVAGGKEGKPKSGDELAVVGRLEYTGIQGLALGASAYQGGANQDNEDALDGVDVTIVEGDVRYRIAGFDLQGVYTQVNIGDAEKINAFNGILPASDESVGEKLVGWYLEGAYDVLRPLALQTEQRLMAFVRYEQINTQEEVPGGFVSDPANDRHVTTYGVAYFPIDQVALKADFERWEDDTDKTGNRFNLGVAYMF